MVAPRSFADLGDISQLSENLGAPPKGCSVENDKRKPRCRKLTEGEQRESINSLFPKGVPQQSIKDLVRLHENDLEPSKYQPDKIKNFLCKEMPNYIQKEPPHYLKARNALRPKHEVDNLMRKYLKKSKDKKILMELSNHPCFNPGGSKIHYCKRNKIGCEFGGNPNTRLLLDKLKSNFKHSCMQSICEVTNPSSREKGNERYNWESLSKNYQNVFRDFTDITYKRYPSASIAEFCESSIESTYVGAENPDEKYTYPFKSCGEDFKQPSVGLLNGVSCLPNSSCSNNSEYKCFDQPFKKTKINTYKECLERKDLFSRMIDSKTRMRDIYDSPYMHCYTFMDKFKLKVQELTGRSDVRDIGITSEIFETAWGLLEAEINKAIKEDEKIESSQRKWNKNLDDSVELIKASHNQAKAFGTKVISFDQNLLKDQSLGSRMSCVGEPVVKSKAYEYAKSALLPAAAVAGTAGLVMASAPLWVTMLAASSGYYFVYQAANSLGQDFSNKDEAIRSINENPSILEGTLGAFGFKTCVQNASCSAESQELCFDEIRNSDKKHFMQSMYFRKNCVEQMARDNAINLLGVTAGAAGLRSTVDTLYKGFKGVSLNLGHSTLPAGAEEALGVASQLFTNRDASLAAASGIGSLVSATVNPVIEKEIGAKEVPCYKKMSDYDLHFENMKKSKERYSSFAMRNNLPTFNRVCMDQDEPISANQIYPNQDTQSKDHLQHMITNFCGGSNRKTELRKRLRQMLLKDLSKTYRRKITREEAREQLIKDRNALYDIHLRRIKSIEREMGVYDENTAYGQRLRRDLNKEHEDYDKKSRKLDKNIDLLEND